MGKDPAKNQLSLSTGHGVENGRHLTSVSPSVSAFFLLHSLTLFVCCVCQGAPTWTRWFNVKAGDKPTVCADCGQYFKLDRDSALAPLGEVL